MVKVFMDRNRMPLRDTYCQIQLPDADDPVASLLCKLPDGILGCHLLGVLEALRQLLQELRAHKAVLDQRTIWDPRGGLQPLAVLLDEEVPWWEGPSEVK